MNLNVSAEVRSQLEATAKRAGRSLSQEAERRLEGSFVRQNLLNEVLTLVYGPRLAGLLVLLGALMDAAGRETNFLSTNSRGDWTNNSFAYDQAVKAAIWLLDTARPASERDLPSEARHDANKSIEDFASSMILAFRYPDYEAPFGGIAEQARPMLGPIAGRIADASVDPELIKFVEDELARGRS
jgi:hypothetical protein